MAQSFYITLGLIIRAENKVLVLHKQRTSDGRNCDIWTLPGGKIDKCEGEKECLVREIKEELGIDISKAEPRFVGYYLDSSEVFKNKNGMLVMKYEVEWAEKFEFELDSEHDEYKWIDEKEFAEFELHQARIPVKEMLIFS